MKIAVMWDEERSRNIIHELESWQELQDAINEDFRNYDYINPHIACYEGELVFPHQINSDSKIAAIYWVSPMSRPCKKTTPDDALTFIKDMGSKGGNKFFAIEGKQFEVGVKVRHAVEFTDVVQERLPSAKPPLKSDWKEDIIKGIKIGLMHHASEDRPDMGYMKKLIQCLEIVTQEAAIGGDDMDTFGGLGRYVEPPNRNDPVEMVMENLLPFFKKINPPAQEAVRIANLLSNENLEPDVRELMKEQLNDFLRREYGKEEPEGIDTHVLRSYEGEQS